MRLVVAIQIKFGDNSVRALRSIYLRARLTRPDKSKMQNGNDLCFFLNQVVSYTVSNPE